MLAACQIPGERTEGPAERTENGGQAITGGVTDANDPAVFAVLGVLPQSQGWFLATGVLVSSHVVLTAAHVVDPSANSGATTFQVASNTAAIYNFVTSENTWNVVETHFDPAFDPGNYLNGHDIGILVLASTTGITPLALNRTPIDSSWAGQPIRYVGYGQTAPDATASFGIRRQAYSTIGSVDSLFLNASGGGSQPCLGDSGGPGFVSIGGVEIVAGITSFGDATCTNASLTRTDIYASVIDPWVAEFDPDTGDGGSSDAGLGDDAQVASALEGGEGTDAEEETLGATGGDPTDGAVAADGGPAGFDDADAAATDAGDVGAVAADGDDSPDPYDPTNDSAAPPRSRTTGTGPSGSGCSLGFERRLGRSTASVVFFAVFLLVYRRIRRSVRLS